MYTLFKNTKIAFLWALFFCLLSFILQVGILSNSQFMGVDSNAFASEILKFYPTSAMTEVLKIFVIIFPLIFLAFSLIFKLKGTSSRLFFATILCLSYIFILLASIIEYPALYEEYLPLLFSKILFKHSLHFNPEILRQSSIIIIILGILFFCSRITKLAVVFGAFFLLITAYFNKTAKAPSLPKGRSHVLLIGIDSLRVDYLNSKTTPELQLLKNSSISFNDHIIGIPRTFPSWMEILQGTYSAQTVIRHMFPGLPQQRKPMQNLVTQLRDSGYETVVISDFAGDIFPRFNGGYGTIQAPQFNLQSLIKMTIDQSFPLFLPILTSSLFYKFYPNLLENPCFSDPRRLVDKAINSIKESQKPLFLTLFFSSAHFPYAAHWPWYSKNADKNYQGPFFFKKDPDLTQSHNITSSDIFQIRSLYSGALSSIDDSLNFLFSYLKEDNLWDDFIIILTADHGEDLFEFERVQGHGEHLRGENVMKVPLLIKLSKFQETPKYTNIDFTTRMIDLAPTILSILNIPPLKRAFGINLSEWFYTNKSHPLIYAYTETEIWFSRVGKAFYQKERIDYPNIASLLNLDSGGTGAIVLNSEYENIINTAKHRSLTQGNFKLIYTPTSNGIYFNLYDRGADPQNFYDVKDQYPHIYAKMKTLLLDQMTKVDNSTLIENYVVPF